jgi:hypothetical protein
LQKRGNISGNINFQISPHGTISVYDLHNTYLKFNVEREYIYTIDAQFGPATTVFFDHKHATGFFNQV